MLFVAWYSCLQSSKHICSIFPQKTKMKTKFDVISASWSDRSLLCLYSLCGSFYLLTCSFSRATSFSLTVVWFSFGWGEAAGPGRQVVGLALLRHAEASNLFIGQIPLQLSYRGSFFCWSALRIQSFSSWIDRFCRPHYKGELFARLFLTFFKSTQTPLRNLWFSSLHLFPVILVCVFSASLTLKTNRLSHLWTGSCFTVQMPVLFGPFHLVQPKL